MSTTTFDAIRDSYAALFRALTPAAIEQVTFDRSPKRWRLRRWAVDNGTSAALRKFEFWRDSPTELPPLMAPDVIQREEIASLTVAYPVELGLYGVEDLDDLEKIARADARLLHDTIYNPNHYVSGLNGAFPEIQPLDTGNDLMWFQEIRVRLIYDEALVFSS